MPKVSVILPVYNAEKYIKRSLLSLLNQTLTDIEIIVINDGSTDKSLSIIQSILKQNLKYQNITKLISRENKGVAATRAEGINLANGDYIIQCDSDDWVEKNWLKLLYETASRDNADIVICDYIDVYKTKQHCTLQECFPSIKENIESLLTSKISNMNWDKLIRKSIITKNNINYVQNINMGEDFLFTLQSFFYAKKISHIPKALYYYNKTNQNSLTHKYSEQSLNDIILVANIAENFLITKNYLNYVEKSFDLFKLNIKIIGITRSNGKAYDIKKGLKLYPEVDYLINTAYAPKILKILYFLNGINMNFINPYILKAFNLLKKIKSIYQ